MAGMLRYLRLRQAARSWAEGGLDLLCPPRCVFCGEEPAARESGMGVEHAVPLPKTVCGRCHRQLTADGPRCVRCGNPGSTETCRGCRGRRSCDGIVVLSSYADDLRNAVLRGKRPAGDVISAALAGLLVSRHRDTLAAWNITMIVPVPMHWLRRLTRGTSAAEELARGVAGGLGVPVVCGLYRRRATRMQNELPIEDRPQNVRGAFRVMRSVAGARVLLVDDVVTSGATLADCRRALLAGGATAVYAAVAAKADHHNEGFS